MTTLTILEILWLLIQTGLSLAYSRAAGRRPPEFSSSSQPPKVCVLMPIRGAEPTLAKAIRGVLAQDYPSFALHIVVDSREDPAWAVAEAEVARAGKGHVKLVVLEEPSTSCGLVCSSLLQLVEELDDSWDLVTFCAADMVVPEHWLQTMVAAMADPAVGTTLGNRWYLMQKPTAGSLLRYLWNAGAVVTMWWCQIPWSGTLALRLTDLRQSGLLEQWSHSLIEDVPSAKVLRVYGKQLRFVPGLLVANQDEISLAAAFRFLYRQMLWARLYHPSWLLIAGNGLAGALLQTMMYILAILAIYAGQPALAAWIGILLLLHCLTLSGLLRVVERAVGKTSAVGLDPGRWFSGLPPLIVLVGIPLTQLIYAVVIGRCLFARSVEWSGIHYRFTGPFEVQMDEYRPHPSRRRKD